MVHTNNNTTYYINPAYLTFVENSGYGANLIQVSASSSCHIRVFIPGEIGYDADGNYRRWKITAYNNRFPDNDAFHIYVRLDRKGTSALVVYSKALYNTDGSTEDGSVPASDTYYYIKIGKISATDGTDIREISYDTGRLESDQVKNEGTELNDMWELDRYSTPWLIRAKQWLAGFTVKGFITLIGGLVFRKGETEKPVTDIKRSFDSEEDVPVSDENVTTSQYVESRLELLDERFLSKIKPDETPHHIKLLDGLTTTHAESTDYAEGTVKGGWAVRKDIDEFWYAEADKLVARVMAKVYDLLVERNAVFKGPLSSSEFISGFVGGKGWAIRLQEYINAAGETEQRSIAEFDDLIVRGTMRVFEFVVNQLLGENDNRIFTGMMEVDHYDAGEGILYLSTNGGKLYNPFRADDIIIVQQYGGMPSEDNDYYVTKQYEFLVTEVGIGDMSAGEDRLDWLKFTNFSSPMEGADMTLITKGDTLVRIDNLYDMRRKGIVQIMSVGEDTPYMDMVYGAKTDPENCVKGRLGNLGGIYNPLFGWLKEFGAYLINLYAVGEFRIAHTGEDVADAIDIAKGSFRTNYRQTTYDMTEEDNFLTNAAMTNDCEGWTLVSEDNSYFTVGEDVQFFNYEPLGSEESYAGISELHGRDMLRLSNASAMQENALIRKPGTHKVFTSTTENEDGTITKNYDEVPDTLYLSVRVYCEASGDFEIGFAAENGTFHENAFHHKRTLEEGIDGVSILLEGVWDGTGNFLVKSSGDMYVDLLSLTDRPLDNYRIETSTSIEQDAQRISLLGKKVNGVEGSVTNLKLQVNAMDGTISSTVEKVNKIDNTIATSGWINSSDSVRIFSEQVNAQGVAKKADLDVYVKFDPASGKIVSGIKLSADQIDMTANDYIGIINKGTTVISSSRLDLSGLVTYSELNTTLGGYATDSELSSAKNELNTSISNLNSTLSTKIDAKAETSSVTSLTNKVNDLNSIVSGKADASALKNVAYLDDAAAAALSGSTIVKNGYLATDYIKVDTIWAVKGTVGGFTIESDKLTVTTELEDDGVFVNPIYTSELSGQGIYVKVGNNAAIESRIGLSWFTDLDTQYFTSVNVANNQVDAGRNVDNACVVRASLNPKDYGLFIEGGSTHILSSGVTKLHGLVLNTRTITTSGTLLPNDDVIIFKNSSSITITLPSSTTVPLGKVYYLKQAADVPVYLSGYMRTSNALGYSNQTINLAGVAWIVVYTDTAWSLFHCGS